MKNQNYDEQDALNVPERTIRYQCESREDSDIDNGDDAIEPEPQIKEIFPHMPDREVYL